MTPPVKKVAPSRSLSDLVGDNKKDKEIQPVDSPEEEFDRDEDYAETEDDKDFENRQNTVVRPEDIKPPVDNTPDENTNTSFDDNDKADKPVISNQVVGTVPNKTPAELAAETPKQTANRYDIDQTITDEDADNPNVQVYRDTHVNQVPSGTHLHPDVAKDLLNRGISEQHTDNAQVKRTVTEYYAFAPDAEHNDKFQKPVEEVENVHNDDEKRPILRDDRS